ncbi:MAG: hypothetical protein KGH59_01140 [Candidatus Micrarchaeota archaeon]|nr:hypothetical protein [Candidatus Micrarchaeota archaeon]MDE1804371.1 hypothetical protein [Candidatus Micrarchaeota archaeon]MDE1846615.1 hypothetical protein [Candidatus Micrarchaeota archaeon]
MHPFFTPEFVEHYKDTFWHKLAIVATAAWIIMIIIFLSSPLLPDNLIGEAIATTGIWLLIFSYAFMKRYENEKLHYDLKQETDQIREDYKNKKISKEEAERRFSDLELRYLRAIYSRGRYVRGAN